MKPLAPPFDLAAWIEGKIAAHRAHKLLPDLAHEVGCSHAHLRDLQAARVTPSNKHADALARLITQDGHTITAAELQDQIAAHIAHRVNYQGRAIWPDAAWAKALEPQP